jgi:cytochrome P450
MPATAQPDGRHKRPRVLSGMPLIGGVLRMRNRPLQTMVEAARLGDVVKLGTLKSRPAYIVSHPAYADMILKSAAADVNRGGLIREIFGRSMFILTGAEWRARRERLLWAYKTSSNPDYLTVLIEALEDVSRRWRDYSRTGEPFDLTNEMMDLARTFTVRAMFGVELDAERARLKDLFNGGMQFRQRRRWNVVELPRVLPTGANRRFAAAKRELDGLVSAIVEKRRAVSHSRHTFLDELERALSEGAGAMASEQDIRDEVVTMFAVGHLTTGAAMVWSLWETLRRPELADQIRLEAAALDAGGFEAARQMKQTLRILQEAWRLYPPVWLMTRSTREALDLGGDLVPAGSIVMISPYAIHRDPRWWSNPEKFDPDRFAEGGEFDRQPLRGAFLPFGAGPRGCPGRDLSTVETVLTLGWLLSRFDLQAVGDDRPAPWPLSMLSPPDGIFVVARERSSCSTEKKP